MTFSHTGPARRAADIEGGLTVLRESGFRATAARRLVLEALFAADGPVSADDLASGLGGQTSRSDLASVYRNLETLEEIGLIHHLHVGHGPGLYVLAREGGREYLTCHRCGALRALDSSAFDGVRDAVRSASGYEARFAHFPIVGMCPACAGSANGNGNGNGAGHP